MVKNNFTLLIYFKDCHDTDYEYANIDVHAAFIDNPKEFISDADIADFVKKVEDCGLIDGKIVGWQKVPFEPQDVIQNV